MDLSGPAYAAFKSKSDGWLDPGASPNVGDPPLPCSADVDGDGPPEVKYYAPVRLIRAKAERGYGGINSSGGPQVSGRSDQTDFYLEQNSNQSSPILYEHCCSGVQLAWVHLAVLKWDDSAGAQLFMHIRLQDVSLTSYRFTGVRFFTQEYVVSELAAETNAPTSATGDFLAGSKSYSRLQDYSVSGIGHRDHMTLLYTSIAFKHGETNTERGWNTGTDDAFP